MIAKKTLATLTPGDSAIVGELKTTGCMRRRFLDIGLVESTPVKCIGRSPGGDPSAYLIRGAVIAIREEDSREILLA
ncbi:MAG: FeoA family protein [Clostridia bacterium]|nr:FeoA family protein [Clostridia bacterium]